MTKKSPENKAEIDALIRQIQTGKPEKIQALIRSLYLKNPTGQRIFRPQGYALLKELCARIPGEGENADAAKALLAVIQPFIKHECSAADIDDAVVKDAFNYAVALAVGKIKSKGISDWNGFYHCYRTTMHEELDKHLEYTDKHELLGDGNAVSGDISDAGKTIAGLVDELNLPSRKRRILKGYFAGESFGEIGEDLGISGVRAVRIFNKTLMAIRSPEMRGYFPNEPGLQQSEPEIEPMPDWPEKLGRMVKPIER